ncbi:hypothetical protein [Kitasatospora paranensis]|uniref:Uncharacterized protein n=1 Tax=Kitasatospora paranensis TaxID=258053 RepID=A0ABW2G8E0_9ACTN
MTLDGGFGSSATDEAKTPAVRELLSPATDRTAPSVAAPAPISGVDHRCES